MLDFTNVNSKEFNELKLSIQKSVEKSDFDRFYLFSTDKFIKAKLFILCFRFLVNACNLLEDTSLKKELKAQIDAMQKTYDNINYYNDFLESNRKYGRHLITQKLFDETNNPDVMDLIDVFAILTERVNIISMDRFKGVVMEGKSGDEFNRVMKTEED